MSNMGVVGHLEFHRKWIFYSCAAHGDPTYEISTKSDNASPIIDDSTIWLVFLGRSLIVASYSQRLVDETTKFGKDTGQSSAFTVHF